MRRAPWWLLGVLALAASVHAADEPLVRAIDLPQQAERLRKAGVPADQVGEAVRATRDKGVAADEATDLLEESAKASEEKGPIDNFGKFVKGKLDEGLRGRELAREIHQEHERRGKGGGPPEGRGPDGEKGGKAPDGGKGGKAGGPDGGKGGKGGKAGGGGGGGKGKGGKGKGGH